MKQMIKFEVKRMLRNPGFYIAMIGSIPKFV